jgi:hypothetical protein
MTNPAPIPDGHFRGQNEEILRHLREKPGEPGTNEFQIHPDYSNDQLEVEAEFSGDGSRRDVMCAAERRQKIV